MLIRATRAEDAEALVAIHRDFCAYYADLDPERFEVPDTTGFAEWLVANLGGEDELDLVAERDGEVIATLYAGLLRPGDGARWAMARDVRRVRLTIEYLATAAAHRRTGAATALVQAAERWGREHGAEVAETTTYHRSPLSMPFWTQRAGYAERSYNFRKPL